jgi:hypothetical protein
MRILKSIGWLWLAIAACGCGGSDHPDTVQATGTVTFNGEPVSGAKVVFAAASLDPATGITDSSGRFELSTFGTNDGAVPGQYAVTVTKTKSVGGMSADEEHAALAAGQKVPPPQTVDELPAKYKSAETSDLTAEVTPDGDNDFQFPLAD